MTPAMALLPNRMPTALLRHIIRAARTSEPIALVIRFPPIPSVIPRCHRFWLNYIPATAGIGFLFGFSASPAAPLDIRRLCVFNDNLHPGAPGCWLGGGVIFF